MIQRLIGLRNVPLLGWIVRQGLLLISVEVPPQVVIGEDLRVEHRGVGMILSANTKIGNRVRLFHAIGTGTKDGEYPHRFAVQIEDDCTVYPGARIIGGATPTILAAGSSLLSNAVLTRSTGPGEVWAGVPARRIA